MTTWQTVRVIAGLFILLSLALGLDVSPLFVNKWWLALTAFAGFNLFQSGFTGFCPPAILLKTLGVPESSASNSKCC